MVFFTTDSLQSQFGGENDQKFGSKRLVQMFQEIGSKSAVEQKNIISNTVETWIDGHIQVDDISLAGIRI
jgi:serine phosphatase RsbU (regulator of sigma subunit)